MDDKEFEVFYKFVDKGITVNEIRGMFCTLVRETNRRPKVVDVATLMIEFLEWRADCKKVAAGELTITRTITAKGEKVAALAASVDNIFNQKGGEKL